jgi:hypothetical protein
MNPVSRKSKKEGAVGHCKGKRDKYFGQTETFTHIYNEMISH